MSCYDACTQVDLLLVAALLVEQLHLFTTLHVMAETVVR